MMNVLGLSGLPVVHAGQASWQRPHSVHVKPSSRSFHDRSATVRMPNVASSASRSIAGSSPRGADLAQRDVGDRGRDVEVLAERQVAQERGDQQHVRPPQDRRTAASSAAGSPPASASPAALAMNAPGTVAVRRDLEHLGQQLGRDDPADHAQDQERVAVEREALGLRHQAPPVGPGDRRRGRSRRRRSASRVTADPQRAVERDRDDRLDQAAGDDVGRADREQHEAPEDPGVQQPGRAGRGTSASGRSRSGACPTGARPGGRSGSRCGPPRTPAGGAPSPGRRTPRRPRTAGTPGRRRGRPRRPGTPQPLAGSPAGRSARPPARAAAWSNGPDSVSSAWSSSGTTTSNDSRAPARRARHVDDQAAAADADEAARQRRERRGPSPVGAHRLGDPGDLVVEHDRGRLGRHVARGQAGAAGGHHEAVAPRPPTRSPARSPTARRARGRPDHRSARAGAARRARARTARSSASRSTRPAAAARGSCT